MTGLKTIKAKEVLEDDIVCHKDWTDDFKVTKREEKEDSIVLKIENLVQEKQTKDSIVYPLEQKIIILKR